MNDKKDEFIKEHTEKVYDNYRIVVTPSTLFSKFHDEKLKACINIAIGIRRHVDDIDEAEPDFDRTDICKFCSQEMEWLDGIPFCCEDARAAWAEWKQIETKPEE